LKAAIELDLFTTIAKGSRDAETIAKAIGASTLYNARAVRILCDYLVIMGFLSKDGDQYSLSLESSIFLDRRLPSYFGGVAAFLTNPSMTAPFQSLAEIVRTGRTTLPAEGTVSHDNPVWVEFAHSMAAMQFPAAQEIAAMVAGEGEMKVLDIAAGHGLFGIMIAQKNAKARVTALDWADVVAVATENAQKLGVADRHTALAGDAFEADFGGLYDLILVTNFFHHFDVPTCEKLMRKIYAATATGGRCVTLDFVPNDDRVSPPTAAGFAMIMLGTTQSGDAYTLAEYQKMFAGAGFASTAAHTLEKSPGTLLVSTKA
jgi:predicted nicotinamide N-methyase